MLPLHHVPEEHRSRGPRFHLLMVPLRPSYRVGMAGFEPAVSCSQGRRIARLSYIPMARRAASGRTTNQVPVGRVALESTSAALQAAAIPSQLPAHRTKKARLSRDAGPERTIEVASTGCHNRRESPGRKFAGFPARRHALRLG